MLVRSSLPEKKLARPLARLRAASARLARRYPGDGDAAQPVHTVYGGAHLFAADTARKVGQVALRALDAHAPDPATFAEALGLPAALAPVVHARVRAKLAREPVEDYRIDFEDGYGHRGDDEEDGHAAAAAAAVAAGLAAGTLPPRLGIRVKPLTAALAPRALRTLDVFVTELVVATGGALPGGFVVTLPKVSCAAEVEVLAEALGLLEDRLELAPGALRLELMVETPQALFDARGRAALPRLRRAAGGRLVGAHLGAYDLTASQDVTAADQRLRHPACDLARLVMKATLAGTGVALSDGATTSLPIAPHRAAATAAEEAENRAAIHAAWRLHADDVRHGLAQGFYQGWDLHPAQLPSRYGAVYAFFLAGLPAAAARLRRFVDQAARATQEGGVFDDAATGQGLLNYFLRGLACGALHEDEAAAAGLTVEELRTRSFAAILAGRAGRA